MDSKKIDKYIVHKNEVFECHQDGLFVGYTRVMPPVPEREPYLTFIGPKIGMEEWRKILAFFVWANDTTHSEVQVRLYFHAGDRAWKAWAFPQERDTGMTAVEIPEKCDLECNKVGLYSKNGWIEAGTVHSHCNSSAFQSGTDKSNEEKKNGIHVTVGNLNKPQFDLHGRVSFRGTFFGVDWSQWFQLPPGLEALPWVFRTDVMKHFLTASPVTEEEKKFPDEWKNNVIVVKRTTVVTQGKGQYPGTRSWEGWDSRDGQQQWEGTRKHETQGPLINHVTAPNLTKKERKDLRRLLKKSGNADIKSAWSDEDTQKLQRASIAVIQLAASLSLETDELLKCGNRHPDMLDPLELGAVADMEDILKKEGVTLDDVEEWITITTMSVATGG